MERKPRSVPPTVRKARKVPKETSWKNDWGCHYFKKSYIPIYVNVPFEEGEKGWNVSVGSFSYKERTATLEEGQALGLVVAKKMAQKTIQEIDKELKKFSNINAIPNDKDWEATYTKTQLEGMVAIRQEDVNI